MKYIKYTEVYFFIIIALFLVSFQKVKPNLTIDAKLEKISEGTIFKLKDLETNTTIDSAYVVNGAISLKGKLNHPKKILLIATDSKSQEFIYTFLFVGNEQVTFEANKKDFPWNINVSGSIHHDKAEKFHHIEQQRHQIEDKLRQEYSADQELLSKKISKTSDSLNNAIVKLIIEHPNSYASLDFFKYHKTKFSNKQLKMLYNTLDSELKETAGGRALKLQSEYPKPKIGSKFYDYRAIDHHRGTLSLSDIKDKYILLHFSSSACYASQLSLPELKEIYENYGTHLEIVSISEDYSREQWQSTVKKDAISWIYLWDGKGEFGDAVIKYWAIGTPNYVLISPKGIILEQWFGYKKGIFKEKLETYFNQ